MLYYRRKILLALLEAFGGEVSAIHFQKLLFLLTRKQETKAFDFVPYRYGCFSFQANQDIATLQTYGYVKLSEDKKKIQLVKAENFSFSLNLFDRQYITEIINTFGNFSQDDLIIYTYVNFPYYATKSTIANRILTNDELAKVQEQKRVFNEPTLFTIGYEGISLETYINKLIINDIKALCDVRKNAFSQKYGFSKSQLKTACEGVGIEYLHIPDLGIVSEKRQSLNSQNDYNALFSEYEQTVLKENAKSLDYIFELLKTRKRIALTCFEKEPCQCHRTRIAKQMMLHKNRFYALKEL
jgi:uncharacterized protein (DUF488 family)